MTEGFECAAKAARQLIVFMQVKSMGWKKEEDRYQEKAEEIEVLKTTTGQKEPLPAKTWEDAATEITSQNLWR
jgi:hypothetical protein